MMKKVFTCFLVLIALFAIDREAMAAAAKKSVSSSTLQDDLAVQAVGGGAEPKSVEPMRFDNVTFGKSYKIDGYAAVTFLGFKFINMFAQWDDGKAGPEQQRGRKSDLVYSQKLTEKNKTLYGWLYYPNCSFKGSGNEAEFAWLKVDVQNLSKMSFGFIKDISVKVIYDDEYEYDGWVRQFNYDYSKSEIYKYQETTIIGWPVCLSPVDEMYISPMYKGHYAFGCTLPNFIVEDNKSPLRMVIKLGEHELTYNIRN